MFSRVQIRFLRLGTRRNILGLVCIVSTALFVLALTRTPVINDSARGNRKMGKTSHFDSMEHISSDDFVTEESNNSVVRSDEEECEIVEIAIVCAGFNASREVVTMIKSILFYRRSPIHVHFIVDRVAKMILRNLFRTWDISDFTVSFYKTENLEEKVAWIPNFHYSGVYGLLKLLLLDVLPKDVHQVIVLDIDLLFLSDIGELWRERKAFTSNQAIGLVENQSDWYLGKLVTEHEPWPAVGRGFNTGLMLLDCDKLREVNWDNMWRTVTKDELFKLPGTSLADQDIINAVISKHKSIVRPLSCFWNVQFSTNTNSERCYVGNVAAVKVLHWNSPKKQKLGNKHAATFRNLFYSFVEYDGALLKSSLSHCSDDEDDPDEYFEEDSCQDMLSRSLQLRRTHLFYLPFEYSPVENDVTLTLHLSMDRLPMLDQICSHWSGPISIAIYLSDSDTVKLLRYLSASPALGRRTNIGFHIVYRNFDDVTYPINLLRNIAWQEAVTNFVFLCDVDFVPSGQLYEHLKNAVLPNHGPNAKRAYVVPAFESLWYKFSFPATKSELLDQWDSGTVTPFRSYIWPQGHNATDYTRWRQSMDLYAVNRSKDYEPYVIVAKNLCPAYDKRFFGFGWNKVSHIMELDAAGFQFLVLPFAFVVHMPHMASLDIMKYRSSHQYRKCIDDIKIEFVDGLVEKYGVDRDKFT